MKSIRFRATLLVSVVLVLVLVGGSVALMGSFRHSLVADQDIVAQSRIEELTAQIDSGSLPSRLTDLGDDIAAQVVDPAGRVIASTTGLRGQGPLTAKRPAGRRPTVRTMRGVPDDSGYESYRMWSASVPTSTGAVSIWVGTSLESTSEATARLRRSLLVGIPLALVVFTVATWFVAGRALRPLHRLRLDVSTISDEALDARVAVPAADELKSLADAVNAMLDRIDRGTRQQRAFVADASHELQSPLAAIRIQLEVALGHPHLENWPSTARDTLADVSRLERLLGDLLFLARADADQLERPSTLVDLDVIVAEEVARAQRIARVEIDASDVSPVPVQGVRDDLARMLRNLIDNAASYATSRVVVAVAAQSGQVIVTVDDDGPGVPPESRETVFERFTRLESARDLRAGGTGLGLAIASAVARRHGGSIAVTDSLALGGAQFVVRLSAEQTVAVKELSPSGTP